MLKPITLAIILLAGLIPAAGLLAGGAWPLAAACAGLGGLWLVGCLRGWDGLASWLLAGFVVLAALGIGARGGSLWAPPAVVMALAAWDLQRFMGRAGALSAGDAGRDLTARHLRRLLAVSGLGLALSWIAAAAGGRCCRRCRRHRLQAEPRRGPGAGLSGHAGSQPGHSRIGA